MTVKILGVRIRVSEQFVDHPLYRERSRRIDYYTVSSPHFSRTEHSTCTTCMLIRQLSCVEASAVLDSCITMCLRNMQNDTFAPPLRVFDQADNSFSHQAETLILSA